MFLYFSTFFIGICKSLRRETKMKSQQKTAIEIEMVWKLCISIDKGNVNIALKNGKFLSIHDESEQRT